MIGERQLLRSYLRGIRRLSGAAGVSLFAPAPWGIASRAVLIHDGPLPPLPELADLTAARAFLRDVGEGSELPVGEELAGRLSAEELLASRLASRESGGVLMPVPTLYAALDALAGRGEGPRHLRRREGDLGPDSAGPPTAWLGLRFTEGDRPGTVALDRPLPDPSRWMVWLLALGGAIASHSAHVSAVLDDPVSGLPGRAELQESLAEALARARAARRPLALLLLNPDDFGDTNDRFGREAGDRVVEQIAARLRLGLRSSDLVARYGGVVFAVVLPDTSEPVARQVAEKLLAELQEQPYLDGALRLGFSAGLACFDPQPSRSGLPDPLELIRRADRALQGAKRSGGGALVRWGVEVRSEEAETLDRLSGIFTGNLGKDYRNMVLLWETVAVVAAHPEIEELAGEVVRRLCATFHAERVALFRLVDGHRLELVRGLWRRPGAGAGEGLLDAELSALPAAELAVAEEACRRQAPRGSRLAGVAESPAGPDHPALAIPLTARDRCLGCLYLDAPDDRLELDASDLIFLQALASQLGIAVDRALLAEQERVHREQDHRRLRGELHELRQALRQAKLLHASPEMEEVLATVRRAAPTEATVLLVGESGTGKGVIARTLHRLSRRADQPLVEVDCGTISATLIDSELFGHEKGAFTGASERSRGRLAEADGGTVLLDEVGELPLEVQGKLLRFVQERQIIAVGATRARTVDVRVIAATNRDLAAEVASGRFRRDLYYRLNVVQIHVPPLRQRRDDILVLAHHFLEQFALQHHKDLHGLTRRAEGALLAYSWPGNVRELQNRILRAVILVEGGLIGPAELGLEAAAEEAGHPPLTPAPAPELPATTASRAEAAPATPAAVTGGRSAAAVAEALRRLLADELERVTVDRARALPLGSWIEEDLLLAAHRRAGGVGRRAAALLGLPESTYRRRVGELVEQDERGLLTRPDPWREVRQLLEEWLAASQPPLGDLLAAGRTLLFAEVSRRFSGDVAIGARLMGVSPPTFRRRLSAG